MNRLNKIIWGIGKAIVPFTLIGLVSCGPKPISNSGYTFESFSALNDMKMANQVLFGIEYRNLDTSLSVDKNEDKLITNKEAKDFLNKAYERINSK